MYALHIPCVMFSGPVVCLERSLLADRNGELDLEEVLNAPKELKDELGRFVDTDDIKDLSASGNSCSAMVFVYTQ